MHFALVNDERTSPLPGLTGSCPACAGAMIAKCGDQRVHHWAHRGKKPCDSWWEPETPWHRGWKSKFPQPWQEFIQFDAAGEKHIADVRTPHGLTIEFQRSHLEHDERAARERFYGNMLWVVDGSRLKRDLPRFRDGTGSFRKILVKGLYITAFPQEAFPRNWLDCAAPVFFDFANAIDQNDETKHLAHPLWCLLPGRAVGRAVVLQVSRASFLHGAHETACPIEVKTIMDNVALVLTEQQRLEAANLHAAQIAMRRRQGWQTGYRRRYARF